MTFRQAVCYCCGVLCNNEIRWRRLVRIREVKMDTPTPARARDEDEFEIMRRKGVRDDERDVRCDVAWCSFDSDRHR